MALAIGNWSALSALPGMDDAEFARWADMLERRTGVVVPPARKPFLVTAVRGRMRETGHERFDDYYRDLHKVPEGAIEWTTLVDRLTVHETHFFRHQPSFDLIANEWLPRLVKSGSQDALHAWSVGCSTGEEAYTLAMVLDRHISALNDARVYFGVTATDVSQPALSVGRSGLYPRTKFSEIPPDYRERYAEEIDADSFQIRESLRKRVGFAQFNLLDVARAPLKRLDLIFCQNVLIYFARDRRRELLGALAGLLKPGGLLVLGAGEVTNFAHPTLSRVPHRQALAFLRNR
ncbi:MAG TPA: protein-glutamate O-methyltransferase CheR [Tahibacter sp.]|uniref:CheR family methyltransferase n=1 Tax=Tahibacter sp. TaxID=2056211 RepID=UPI002CE0B11D|nr:protein-glutamate O-methyltransferase CheR [Tahibacter sp.]HSX60294.1 protein-glutamate O-methyltransferase CheR [Tahibacter sp.]